MKILLINHLMRPQTFTLEDKSTLRLTARGTEGFKKEIEKKKLSKEVTKAVVSGLITMVEITDPTYTPTIEKSEFKKSGKNLK